MADNDFYKGELPVNYEQKCPVTLVLDSSGSMAGEPINELIGGLRSFIEEIKNDTVANSRLEVSIITFNSNVKVLSGFQMVDQMSVPELTAQGSTKLADGVNRAIQVLETRKDWYKGTGQRYYRPFIILITDGYPDGDQDLNALRQTIHDGVKEKKFNFWAFGVKGASLNMLKQISHESWPPQMIKGVEFVKFFQWLSASLGAITKSREGEKLNLAPKDESSSPFQITM
jgi:uncharacterized protein YegL